MKSVLVSEFKARCVGLLNEVHDARESILVTKRGRALARVVPAVDPATPERVPGESSDCARITGEIVETDQSAEWESL